jgi:hypothetical protein
MEAFLIGAVIGFVLLSAWKFWTIPAETVGREKDS